MPLTRRQRRDVRSPYSGRRRARRIRLAVAISLLIHIGIGVLLLVTFRRQERSELLPPPSAVTMLFDTGRKEGPTLPEPGLQAVPPAPETPAVEPPLPSPPIPPPAISPPPPPPAPSPPRAPAPPPVPSPPPAPAPPVQEVPAPLPPAVEPGPMPLPPRQQKPQPAPKPPDVRPLPKQAAPSRQPDFPAPMNFSFGAPRSTPAAPARPRPAPHPPGSFDMSLGPAAKGATNTTPFADRDDAEGADWRNALSRWVSEHAYYPEQARRELEEGDAKVRVVAEPDGRVKLVELIGRSGSMWLDLALLALFRDAHIPPLPSGEREGIDFNFTMHYILIRPR
jgi:periplasmic protein TonB